MRNGFFSLEIFALTRPDRLIAFQAFVCIETIDTDAVKTSLLVYYLLI